MAEEATAEAPKEEQEKNAPEAGSSPESNGAAEEKTPELLDLPIFIKH